MSDASVQSDDFSKLLELQGVDTSIDQLLHKRAALPAVAAIEQIKTEAVSLRNELANATTNRDALSGRQASLEAEIETIVNRIAQIDARMYGTTAVAPKDAQAMSEEADHLRERKSALEDDELEIMEALEPAQATVDEWQAKAQKMASDMQSAQAELTAQQADIDGQVQARRNERATLATSVPSTLLAEYEKLRAQLGGVAVARLQGTQCGGCHLTMAGAELAAVKNAPEGSIVHCDECGRILVR